MPSGWKRGKNGVKTGQALVVVGFKIRKALRSTVPEVRSAHGLFLRRTLVCNVNTAGSWAGGQESARRPALVGVTSMAEFVVSAFVDRSLKTGVGCLLRRWRASTASKGSLGGKGPIEAQKGSRTTQVGLSCAPRIVNWSAMSLEMGNQSKSWNIGAIRGTFLGDGQRL